MHQGQQSDLHPDMKGCVLAGRYVFTGNDEKNKRYREKLWREAEESKKTS